eukprot:gnl/TRDRNA2_/TRDRNA2_66829_c0_seq1.p1 gnl/TRDRNA2_/TRDRNA2_66829_c0~~gnl/TRDRNA2_/TRDRNA2_66829_c0_seq1.p1  ORF type:complete len:377 (+),score=92.16 gnl/TRDRNA2_/TRDRNA2_66829_c0_seq1:80-1210(+)
MMDCVLVDGPREGTEVMAGNAIQWVLANSGTTAWPEMTTLRLVGGPLLMPPVTPVPVAAPGQTVVIDLEVVEDVCEVAEVFYVLVDAEGHTFGEILSAKIVPKKQLSVSKPVCVIIESPPEGLEGLQGEIKTVEWTLANIGETAWPKDVKANLFYNTPNFMHLPVTIDIPSIEPGMTVVVGSNILMPEAEGTWKAMWAVNSPTHPDFGDVLYIEAKVSEFPFMDWMLCGSAAVNDNEASSGALDLDKKNQKTKFSMSVVAQQHRMHGDAEVYYDVGDDDESTVSLGRVTGLVEGQSWVLELLLSNNGDEAWPAGTRLASCFGSDLGCSELPLADVEVGETVQVQVELRAPGSPFESAWILTNGDECFGPLLTLASA